MEINFVLNLFHINMRTIYNVLQIQNKKVDNGNAFELTTIRQYLVPDDPRLSISFDTEVDAWQAIRDYGRNGLSYHIEKEYYKSYDF